MLDSRLIMSIYYPRTIVLLTFSSQTDIVASFRTFLTRV